LPFYFFTNEHIAAKAYKLNAAYFTNTLSCITFIGYQL